MKRTVEKSMALGLYNCVKFRLNWKQSVKEQEAENVVKGLSRKVIIVKSPDPKIFEQAIFIVRDDYLSTQGVGQKELLKQAQAAANGYVSNTGGWHRFAHLPPMLLAILGAGAAAIVYLAVHFFGIF